MKIQRRRFASSVFVALLAVGLTQGSATAQTPFKLGVEERGYIQDPHGGGEAQYPSPEMVPTGQPLNGSVDQSQRPKKAKPTPPRKPLPLHGNATEQVPQRQPMQMGIQQSVQLPPGFMGSWVVNGMRQNIEALPQYQAAIPTIFQGQTQDVWTIGGNPNSGYSFSNEAGVKTSIFVDKVQGDTAFIRYQHPIKNTMAQEAIVMQIAPGGAQFKGLERISIVKQGEPGPRAKVTYQLMGRRR